MPRWLLPLIAVLALCGRTVTAFAAAGWCGKTACCCPNPQACKCHDHGGKQRPAAELKRCGGDAKLVAPDAPIGTLPAQVPVATATIAAVLAPVATATAISVSPVPPEPPPI